MRTTGPAAVAVGAEEAAATTGNAGEAPDGQVRLEMFASGFDRPLFVTHAGDGSGRLFVVEQGGRIRIVRDGKVLSTPFLDLSKRLDSSSGERGLLGLAFAPDFATSRRFFVAHTAATAAGPAANSSARRRPLRDRRTTARSVRIKATVILKERLLQSERCGRLSMAES